MKAGDFRFMESEKKRTATLWNMPATFGREQQCMDKKMAWLIEQEKASGSPVSLRNAQLINQMYANQLLCSSIESILTDYNKSIINTEEALINLSTCYAQSKNSLREGCLFIEGLFGSFGPKSVQETDKELIEKYGTCDWVELNKRRYSRVYGEKPVMHYQGNDHVVRIESKGLLTPRCKRLLKELNNLIGLNRVKLQVQELIDQYRVSEERKKRGIKTKEITKHMVFLGNPGTGKTTVANKLGKIFKEIGILSEGHVVYADRAQLVGKYVGETEKITSEKIAKARGGILFIDEAYALAPKDGFEEDYGPKAIETLLTEMENHRDEFIVIAAGYPEEMTDFINSNPGLRSRFSNIIYFDDFTGEELYQIFQYMIHDRSFHIAEDAVSFVQDSLNAMYTKRDAHFANAREVRNLIDRMDQKLSGRIAQSDLSKLSDVELQTITYDDAKRAIEG